MAQITVKGYIIATQHDWETKPVFSYQVYKPSAEYSPGTVIVREHSIDFDVPDNFDPTPEKIAMLHEQKRQLRVKLAEELATIDDRISKLSALTFEAA